MKSQKGIAPNDVVNSLQSGYREAAVCEASLEETRDRLRRLFDAVSDAVFLFQGWEITLKNENGRRLLDSFGGRSGSVSGWLYDKAGQVLRGVPVTLRVEDAGRQRVLVIHSAKALRMESGNAMLVTVVDLTESMEQTARLERASAGERRRIARDLHDGLSQLLTSLQFQAQALAMQRGLEPGGERYVRIAELALICAGKGRELHREFYEI